MSESPSQFQEMNVRLKEETDGTEMPSFVKVPSSSDALQELVLLPESASTTTDPVMDAVEPYFRLKEGETVNLELLQKQADKEREEGCSTGMCPHVSPTTLRLAAEAGTVERLPLKEDGAGICLYMYLDESANLKERPLNSRAMKLAQTIDYDGDIFGDVFLARLKEKKSLLPINISELLKQF